MKRKALSVICTLALFICMLGSVPLNASANELPVSISFEGKLLEFTGAGGIIEDNGRLLAPAGELASQTGWKMEFYNNAPYPSLIKLVNEPLGLTVEAYTGSGKIFINGQERAISTPPVIKDGIVFFPVRDFFYAMNCSVRWIDSSRTVDATLPLAKVFSGKEVVAKKAGKAPVIDGSDEDAAWEDAKKLGDFSRIFFNDAPSVETNFKVTYDDSALYIFIKCDGKPVPLEGISLVIAPQSVISPDTPYYRIMLVPQPENNLGRTGGINVSYRTSTQIEIIENGKPVASKDDPNKMVPATGGFDAEYVVEGNSWSAEVKIPCSSLISSDEGTAPVIADAGEWKLNVSRVRPFTEGISSWVPLRYSFYQDLPTGDISYSVDIPFAAISNRTGSIFFGDHPSTDITDNPPKPYITVAPENPGMLYQGYTRKLLFFDKRNLKTDNTKFVAEFVNELGEKYKTDILRVSEDDSRIYFLVEHPKMINEGLYRFNIYADEGKNKAVRKYEIMFDKQAVMDAGVKYTSFALNTSPTAKTAVQKTQKSSAVEKLISIIPRVIGFRFTGNPDRPADKADGLYVYDYANSPYKITAKLAGNSGTKVTVEKGIGTLPAQYADNRSLTAVTKTGKTVTYNYYEDENGLQYFLDEQIDYMAKDELRKQITALSKTDPLGTAYVLYEIAKAYQDWLPSCDYYWRNYPIQWNWGPPFHYYGGMWNRWYCAELSSMKEIVDAYSAIKNTNALDIVSEEVGINVEDLLIEGMFKPALEYTKTYPILNHNMEYNNWLGRIALSKATGDPDYIHETIDLVDYYASSQFMLDGFWKEVSVSYHSQSLNGLTATIAALKGWSDPVGYISPRTGQNIQNLDMDSKYPALKAANLMTASLIYPNGNYFPIQDTWANDRTNASAANRNLGTLLLPAANIARMSKGTGNSTNQLYLAFTPKYGHNQFDPLSLTLYSNNQELLPDLGYTHTIYRQWSASTLAHNTVLVDSKDSSVTGAAAFGGKINTFADMDENVQVMKASQENAYPGLNEYDREPWYIKMEGSDDSYVLDIFRVDGGSRHEYTLNGDANSEKVTFTPNVEMADYSTHLLPPGTQVTMPTGELDKGSAEGNYYGYLYIEDVKKAELADGKYEITMTTQDGDTAKAGMKITGFAGSNAELFIGKAPSLRPLRIGPAGTANDKNEVVTGSYMPKMVVRREGTDLKSTFVNVMEPYSAGASPKITSVEKLDTGNPMDVAVKISYGNVTDVILSSSNPAAPLNAWDISLTGKMAFIRYIDGKASLVYTVGTDNVVVNGQSISGAGKISGKVTATMRKASGDAINAFVVDAAIGDSAIGKTMTVKHPDGSVNAFEVAGVTPQGTGTIVEVKDMDPGFEILKDGSSEMRFYPLTKWQGDHTFEICGETINSIE